MYHNRFFNLKLVPVEETRPLQQVDKVRYRVAGNQPL
jgi:hypothetical protein